MRDKPSLRTKQVNGHTKRQTESSSVTSVPSTRFAELSRYQSVDDGTDRNVPLFSYLIDVSLIAQCDTRSDALTASGLGEERCCASTAIERLN